MRKGSGVLVGIFTVVFFSSVFPLTAQETLEHPLIRPFPGGILDERLSTHDNFNTYDFPVTDPATGRGETHTVKGEFRYLVYNLPEESGDVSPVEIFENYKAAALGREGEVKYDDRVRGAVFTVPREDGGITWCRVEATDYGRIYLHIIDEEALETSLVFGPAELKAALDADGKIVLHNILFGFDKATLQQSSDQQLQHVLTLLNQYPDIALEVQGHTDGDGSEEYNLELSQRRSESVVDFFVLFGIDPGRLQAKGYGESVPVAPNDTDENKAQNRRVELVKVG